MVEWLEEFLQKQKPNQNALLKSFTRNTQCWPLKNLDMCLLQSLTLDGRHLDPHFPNVMDLFAAQLFANLAKLTLKGISFDGIITFTNVQKLKSLVINYCDDLLFEFPEKIQLKSLAFSSGEQAELLTHLLTQVRGLKKLHITTHERIVDRVLFETVRSVVSPDQTKPLSCLVSSELFLFKSFSWVFAFIIIYTQKELRKFLFL